MAEAEAALRDADRMATTYLIREAYASDGSPDVVTVTAFRDDDEEWEWDLDLDNAPFFLTALDVEPGDTPIAAQPNYEAHAEGKAHTPLGDVYCTDTGMVGGLRVGRNGAYLYRNGRLYSLPFYIDR